MSDDGMTNDKLIVGDCVLLLLAEAFEAEADGLAGAEVRGRLHSHADTAGGAGGDDVAGVKGEELAEVADEFPDAEDHGGSAAVLAANAIDVQPDFDVLGVGDFVFGDEPGAEGAEGVAAFALGPLAATVFLEGPLADVVGDAVAGDIVEGVGLADVLGLRADDDAELGFPVGLSAAAGDAEVVVGADDGARGLHEEDGLFRDGGAGFGGVLGVIQADAHHFPSASDRGAEAGGLVDLWQLAEVERAELVE